MPLLMIRWTLFKFVSSFLRLVDGPRKSFAVTACGLCIGALPAHAVVVRGTVADALGKAVPDARVILVQHGAEAAYTLSGSDGSYEIRSAATGRFTLLTTAQTFQPSVGDEFYGTSTSIVMQDVIMDWRSVTQRVTVTATGLPTPIQQASGSVTLVSPAELATRLGLQRELQLMLGVSVVQTGQTGSTTSLFVRGGNSDANKVLIDGVPADDVGGGFDFGNVSSTGIGGLEFYRGPDSAVYGTDALASVISLRTPRGTALKPRLDYSGDVGTLDTWRNEVALSGAHGRADYYGAVSRLDTSNDLPMDRYHDITVAANLGYSITPDTLIRGTLRSSVSAVGVPGPYAFFGITSAAKQGDQDLFTQVTLENRSFDSAWHNLIRYGAVRKREQYIEFYPAGTPITDASGTTYYGDTVTIRGANGTSATGRAAIAYGGTYPQRQDLIALRDDVYLQSDYTLSRHFAALATARFEDERGRDAIPNYGTNQTTERPNFQYTAQVQGDIASRLFLSLGGAFEKNHLFGTAATPRFGLSYVPVRSGRGLHGTQLRGQFSKGVQEPSLTAEFGSLYGTLLVAGDRRDLQNYGIQPLTAQRVRSYEGGLDQNILGERFTIHVTYFHNEFDHQLEYVSPTALQQYFGLPPFQNLYGAYLNSEAYRAQGLENEAALRLTSGISLRAGYTWLDARVQRSFASDALAARQGNPVMNPNLQQTAIGSTSPLVGNRPFRRPGNTGYVDALYSRSRLDLRLQAAFVGKADDSTFLGGATPRHDNSLLLPNQDLDYGYIRLDLGGSYRATSKLSVFAQLNNLLNDQHMAPIGYVSLPFTARIGIKLRLGGE
jgi:vitamin B12 transporter